MAEMKDNKKQIQVTEKGLKTLKLELDELVNKKRPQVVERLSRARSEGDLSENSDYHAARDELEFLDGRVAELRLVVDNAQVVKKGSNDGTIDIGTQVEVVVNGSEHVYEIVGEWEADPGKKRISHSSPLGQALVGKKKGDEVEVEAPAGKIIYQILSVKSTSS